MAVSAGLETQPVSKQLNPALPGQGSLLCPMTWQHLEKGSRTELAPQRALLLGANHGPLSLWQEAGPVIMVMIQRPQTCLTAVPSSSQPQHTGCRFLHTPVMFMPSRFCSANSFYLDILLPHSFLHIQLKCQLLSEAFPDPKS